MTRDPKFRIRIKDTEGKITTHILTVREIMGWMPSGKPITIEQYPNIKDKKRNDICEGDIVKPGYCQRVATVIFQDGLFLMKGPDDKENLTDDHEESIPFLTQSRASDIEIIGNIYENPELLED